MYLNQQNQLKEHHKDSSLYTQIGALHYINSNIQLLSSYKTHIFI